MSKYKNERGVALVMTMFIITIILLFITAQLFQVTNTRKQVSTMEKNILAEHMAEMGIDYYRALVDGIKPGEADTRDKYIAEFAKTQKEHIKQTITSTEKEGNRSYLIHGFTIQYESNNQAAPIKIEFKSTGEAYGVTKTIKSTITIQITLDGNSAEEG